MEGIKRIGVALAAVVFAAACGEPGSTIPDGGAQPGPDAAGTTCTTAAPGYECEFRACYLCENQHFGSCFQICGARQCFDCVNGRWIGVTVDCAPNCTSQPGPDAGQPDAASPDAAGLDAQ